MSVEDAIEMVTAAEKFGVVFATNHHLRNAGSHLKIKELIQTEKSERFKVFGFSTQFIYRKTCRAGGLIAQQPVEG